MTSENYIQIINKVDLSNLKEKSIFITGGTGFFGSWLLKLFIELNTNNYNIKVTLLSRDPNAFLKKNPEYNLVNWLEWVKGDVVNYAIPNHKFDYIIHGAANTTTLVFEKPAVVLEEIFFGTKHVLEHAKSIGVKRFFNISSGAVYGEVSLENKFIDEETNTAPLTNKTENAYGEGKRAAEILAYSYAKENLFEIVTARCFGFSGYGIGKHLILNILLNQAKAESEIVIKGSGLARRSFLHGQDLAIWLLKILIDGANGEIYNVGSDDSYTIVELAELIKEIISPNKQVKLLGEKSLDQRINYIPSINKAKLLGLDVWTPITESITEMSK